MLNTRTVLGFIGAAMSLPLGAAAQGAPLNISTKNGTELEGRGKAQLERLVTEYDVAPWFFTRDVIIESFALPHSHPILTVNTRYVDDDLVQLSTFLHEQFHWWGEAHPDEVAGAISEFREIYREVPVRGSGGARDEYSTYLHLIVCDLELAAMTRLVGENTAREIIRGMTHYEWIYERVLTDPRIRQINTRHGAGLP